MDVTYQRGVFELAQRPASVTSHSKCLTQQCSYRATTYSSRQRTSRADVEVYASNQRCLRLQAESQQANLASEQVLIHRRFMEEVYEELALRVLHKAGALGDNERLMIGIAGVPGSGKSTLAKAVCGRVNYLYAKEQAHGKGPDAKSGDMNESEIAIVVPMDGFHYYKAQLRAMPDPEELMARRGAHWTFDGQAFFALLQGIHTTGEASVPAFAHGVGDPEPGKIQVQRHHKAILIEGNYILFDEPPWASINSLLTESWYVDCNLERAMDRVYMRHVGTGKSTEEATRRVQNNDRLNAILIYETMKYANIIIDSVPYRDMVDIW